MPETDPDHSSEAATNAIVEALMLKLTPVLDGRFESFRKDVVQKTFDKLDTKFTKDIKEVKKAVPATKPDDGTVPDDQEDIDPVTGLKRVHTSTNSKLDLPPDHPIMVQLRSEQRKRKDLEDRVNGITSTLEKTSKEKLDAQRDSAIEKILSTKTWASEGLKEMFRSSLQSKVVFDEEGNPTIGKDGAALKAYVDETYDSDRAFQPAPRSGGSNNGPGDKSNVNTDWSKVSPKDMPPGSPLHKKMVEQLSGAIGGSAA